MIYCECGGGGCKTPADCYVEMEFPSSYPGRDWESWEGPMAEAHIGLVPLAYDNRIRVTALEQPEEVDCGA